MQTAVESTLIKRDELAKRLNISPRSVDKLCATGKIPKPLKIGFSVRWNPEKIESWITAGCPSLEEQEVSESNK